MNKRLLAHRIDGPTSAPAVVLLHPIATHSALWDAQVLVWSRLFRVIRIDLPGHGDSDPPVHPLVMADYADLVCEVLDALKVTRTAVVGLSLGGMVAQAVALSRPERVSALVLAHTSARTDAAVSEVWARRMEQFELHGMEAQVAPTLERWFTRDFAARSPLTLAWVAEQIRSTSSVGYTSAVHAIRNLDHLDRLKAVSVPTLVVAGAADSAVPPAVGARLAEQIPGARLVVLDDAAHIGNVQQPVAFTEAVGGFLSDVLAARLAPA